MADCSSNGNIIDLSNISYPGEPVMYKTLDAVDYGMIAIIVILMIGTFFGNVSVIISVVFNKSMQKAVNIYVANLAVADLLICGICMTSFLCKILVENYVHVLAPAMCKISSFGRVTCLISSVVSLSAIACDRLPAILFPDRNLSFKHCRGFIIFAIWLFSASVSLPLLFYRKFYEIVFSDFTMPTCGENWPMVYNEEKGRCESSSLRVAYYTFVSVLLCFLPATIISVAYSLILPRALKPFPGVQTEAIIRHRIKQKEKILKKIIPTIVFFLICWMPLHIIILYGLYKSKTHDLTLPVWYEDAYRFTEFLALFNSFCNPIIYGLYNKKYRKSLCFVLRCKTCGKSEVFTKIRLTHTTTLSTSGNQTKGIRRISGKNQLAPVISEAVIDSHRNGGNTNSGKCLQNIELITVIPKDGETAL